ALWSGAYDSSSTRPDVLRTAEEEAARVDLGNTLTATLQARVSAMTGGKDTPSPVGEGPTTTETASNGLAEFPIPLPWILDPRDYAGEFIEYLVDRKVRNAVKEKVKEQLRPLAGRGYTISIIAHSWGTVVSYESLLDLETEAPNFKLANFFTL